MSLFTPRQNSISQRRIQMDLSEADAAKIERGHAWKADVTDQKTGKRYHVKGAACSSPHCFCDAVIVRRISN